MPFINWSAEIIKYMGSHLPHWHQYRAMQFVTFRLCDSLPQTVLQQLEDFKTNFSLSHPKPWDTKTYNEYYDNIGPYQERMLNSGMGSCLLRNPVARKYLSEALFYGDGTRYNLIAFVIMPNHVHLLMEDLMDEDVNDIMKSIQRFTATKINRLFGRKGRLWMDDDFDRIVRSLPHYHHCLSYIVSNPTGLPPTDYSLYVKEGIFECPNP